MSVPGGWGRAGMAAAAMALVSLGNLPARAQARSSPRVLLLSDIHLDPMHDPARFVALTRAPVAQWDAILRGPASPGQAAAYAALQTACNARGVDTPMTLLASSLRAERAAVAHPLFVTVSGDLMAHQFDCRYRTLAAQAGLTVTAASYSAFAAKTVAFVAGELRRTFPGVPVYLALGNNDSGCKDYEEDPGSAFLAADAHSFAAAAIAPASRAAIEREASRLGDYTVRLPLPRTRLIVLQDIFASRKYAGCKATPAAADTTAASARGPNLPPAQEQIAWLLAALARARAAHERVWVMAHIPPGVDAYSTLAKARDLCKGEKAEMFLHDDALAATLAAAADVVTLALFGHTHMDEMRAYAGPLGVVPGKLVPSITPVNGNTPAFTVAVVDPATATLADYTVYVAGNPTGETATGSALPNSKATGSDTTSGNTTASNTISGNTTGSNATRSKATNAAWTVEYRYATAYQLPAFDGASAKTLTDGFLADKAGAAPRSQAYERFFVAGGADAGLTAAARAMALRSVWPTYACSMTQTTQAGFKDCVCSAGGVQ